MIVFLSGVVALLERPGVAVGVGEVGEAGVVAALRVQPGAPAAGPRLDRVLVPDGADGDAAGDESRPRAGNIGRDEMQVVHPAGSSRPDQLHRSGRSGRGELYDPELGGGVVVDVEGEAGLFGVEGERTVDVADRKRNDFQRKRRPDRGVEAARQEVPDQRRDLVAGALQQEVTAVE